MRFECETGRLRRAESTRPLGFLSREANHGCIRNRRALDKAAPSGHQGAALGDKRRPVVSRGQPIAFAVGKRRLDGPGVAMFIS